MWRCALGLRWSQTSPMETVQFPSTVSLAAATETGAFGAAMLFDLAVGKILGLGTCNC